MDKKIAALRAEFRKTQQQIKGVGGWLKTMIERRRAGVEYIRNQEVSREHLQTPKENDSRAERPDLPVTEEQHIRRSLADVFSEVREAVEKWPESMKMLNEYRREEVSKQDAKERGVSPQVEEEGPFEQEIAGDPYDPNMDLSKEDWGSDNYLRRQFSRLQERLKEFDAVLPAEYSLERRLREERDHYRKLYLHQLTLITSQTRELERWRHGETVEGDYICPDSIKLNDAMNLVKSADALAEALDDYEKEALRHSMEPSSETSHLLMDAEAHLDNAYLWYVNERENFRKGYGD